MMRQNIRLFRLTASVAIGALLCNTVLPAAATAQPAPPPQAAPSPAASSAQPDQDQGDPPARVGRIASESGAVSFRTSADTQWSAATLNYPVSAGNAFWTEPTAQAELEISASRVDSVRTNRVRRDHAGRQRAAGDGAAGRSSICIWSISPRTRYGRCRRRAAGPADPGRPLRDRRGHHRAANADHRAGRRGRTRRPRRLPEDRRQPDRDGDRLRPVPGQRRAGGRGTHSSTRG